MGDDLETRLVDKRTEKEWLKPTENLLTNLNEPRATPWVHGRAIVLALKGQPNEFS